MVGGDRERFLELIKKGPLAKLWVTELSQGRVVVLFYLFNELTVG